MQRNHQVEAIKQLMAHLDAGTNVDAGGLVRNPVVSYTCPDIAAREWQLMFQDYPQLLGMSADLSGPGSFFTSDDLGTPILCTRDGDGRFHAFLNVCRHRGAVVETARRGRRKLFSCPFHAWGYSSAGELVAVPKEHQFGTVEKSCRGLVELPAVERHGLLWVGADPQMRFDIDDLLGDLGPELATWELGESVYQWDVRYDTPMNWKLAVDTFGETYHFNRLHRNTLADFIYGNCQLYDTYKNNHRMMLCNKTIDLLRAMPESEWHILKAALPVYFVFPNVQLIFGRDGPTVVRIYPDATDPHQSHSQISFYRHDGMAAAGAIAGVEEMLRPEDIDERARSFAEIIQSEDYVAAASCHRGAVSGAQDYVIFGRNEPALHHYHNTWRKLLGMPTLELLASV